MYVYQADYCSGTCAVLRSPGLHAVHISSAAVLYVPGGQLTQELVTTVPFVELLFVVLELSTESTVPNGHVSHCDDPGTL
jgi:hypothetical protein